MCMCRARKKEEKRKQEKKLFSIHLCFCASRDGRLKPLFTWKDDSLYVNLFSATWRSCDPYLLLAQTTRCIRWWWHLYLEVEGWRSGNIFITCTHCAQEIDSERLTAYWKVIVSVLLTTYLIFSISKLQLDYYTYWSCQTGAPGADFVGSLWGVLPLSFHDVHDVARWQTCNAPSVSFFLTCWNLELFWLPRTDTTLWIWQWERDVFCYRAKRTSGYCRSSLSVYTWWFLSYALFFTINHRQWDLTCLWHSWLYSFFHSLLIWPCVVGILETWRFSVEAYCCTVGHGMFNGKDIWTTHILSIWNIGRSVNLLFFRFFWKLLPFWWD